MSSQNQVLTAHIVVNFQSAAANANVVAEIDDRVDGYNGGKTTFYPGDTPFMLLFIPDGYVVDQVLSSAGSVAYVEDSKKFIDTYLTYANEDQASLSYPFGDSWTYVWLGNNAGVISLPDQYTAKLPTRNFNTATKKLEPEYRIGVARVTYNSKCKVYKLYNVPLVVGQVIVFFVVKPAS